MKTALIYSSKYGSTERIAIQISGKLNFPVDLINIADKKIETKNYDAIILGMPVLAESTNREMRHFINSTLNSCSNKIIAVFLLCWNINKWESYLNKLFNDKLPENCITACIGGEFNFEKMMDIEKSIVTDLTGITKTTSKISQAEIANFIAKVNKKYS